jgi:eukaryotic-like serine/threonine-protein kinase
MIGQGGAGVIYRAVDRDLEQEVALKVLRAPGGGSVSKLKSEFRARADLHHPNLLQLFELVVTDEHAFFTMELVDAVDFLDWIWRGTPATPAAVADDGAQRRLAGAMRDVVSGLAALHGAGLVHFDVKPGNILVDRAGRVRLADFGLSTEFRTEAGASVRDTEGAGTPYYMAPERRRGGIITPASDLYSVGATMLEALTGSPRAALEDPPGDPSPLLAIARRLMARDPQARPSAREALDTLHAIGGGAAAAVVHGLALRLRPEAPFVGRTPQLAAMQDAFERADETATATIHVHGPSGIGKTALVRRFLDGVRTRHPDVVILRGRCHPYEQIAFCGIDRVVDELSDYMRSGGMSVEGIAPHGLAALVRLFPSVPSRVDPAMVSTAAGTSSLRHLGFAALRELLARAAAVRRLILWIDDLQWVDDDTLEVLRALQAIPRATFILSYRLDDTGTRSRLDLLRGNPPAPDLGLLAHSTDLPLGILDAGDLESLFRTLAPEISPETCKELAVAAGGYPIFAHVLGGPDAHPVNSGALARPGLLAAWLNGMVDALPATQRALFDTIVVAPGPVAMSVVMHAAAADQPLPSLRALEQLGIVSRSSGRGVVRVLPLHDRLRQVRLERIHPAEYARIHRALARSHEQLVSFDFEALTHHYHELGEDERAGQYSVLAGDRASASLAFGAAASYYARAIEWLPDRKEPWELIRKLAECEANRGHGQDAGGQFEQAARVREHIEGPSAETTRLQLRAAEQMLRSGAITDGFRVMRDVLSALGVKLPTSHRGALARSVVLRLGLLARGTRFSPRAEAELDDRERLRMDALWMASTSLAHVNFPLADVLLLLHGRSAIASGEPSRILRFLTYEAAAEVILGSRYFDRRAAALTAQADQLRATVNDDYNSGWYHASYAANAFFRADWRASVAHAETAEAHLTRHGVGIAWERAVAYQYWLFALALTAQPAKLEERRRIALEDALARRDRLAENHCRSGYTSLLWLFRDDLDTARRERQTMRGLLHPDRDPTAVRRWPEDSFATPDYHDLIADTHIELYAGAGLAAHARIEEAWPLVERALLLRLQFAGVDLRFLRARCALAASLQVGRGRMRRGGALDPHALRRIASHELSRIARDRNPVARPYHGLLAGLLRPDAKPAAGWLDDAARSFDALVMPAHAAAARFRHGELVGGSEGAKRCSDALDSLSAAGIVRPSHIIQLFAPAPLQATSFAGTVR